MVDDLRKAVNIYRRRRDGLSERLRDVALVVCVLQEWDRSRHLDLGLLAATLAGATLVASAICGWCARFATSTATALQRPTPIFVRCGIGGPGFGGGRGPGAARTRAGRWGLGVRCPGRVKTAHTIRKRS